MAFTFIEQNETRKKSIRNVDCRKTKGLMDKNKKRIRELRILFKK